MTDVVLLEGVLAGAYVDAAVFALRPDYRVLLLGVDGLVTSPGDHNSDALLQAAESAARQALSGRAVDDLVSHLARFGPGVHAARRLIASGTTALEGD